MRFIMENKDISQLTKALNDSLNESPENPRLCDSVVDACLAIRDARDIIYHALTHNSFNREDLEKWLERNGS